MAKNDMNKIELVKLRLEALKEYNDKEIEKNLKNMTFFSNYDAYCLENIYKSRIKNTIIDKINEINSEEELKKYIQKLKEKLIEDTRFSRSTNQLSV